jgi:hypothetical protein
MYNFLVICFSEEVKFDPRGPFPKEWEKRLNVTVISAYQLPKLDKRSEVVDPFVKVSIYGVNGDKQEKQTKVIKNNGKSACTRVNRSPGLGV